MDSKLIKNCIKIIVKEVMKKVHRKDYKGVEGIVNEIKIGIEDFINTMKCIEEMLDLEDCIDEVNDDTDIIIYELVEEAHYRADHRLKLYGDELFITMEFEFFITETGMTSILRGINV
ncbi:hypothetical protein IMSAGC011_01656 [Lachnospiraceae bacterium]|nr:hypothetical protein IMSAGC011_01656 [Lachnospiraceae bacterium]